ncbi:PhoX family protein [Sediminicoccus rosea]|uniref:PhoX family phosphatase n=1 Tax=Sediminicoccus rosea TaxID=1225128 RepID=A0ABZ0PBG2_9PROT|nr:PhoX family phosphatase [Sediminicoccus rosea]WPB83040.1 PhoX family phosphatase [Sediminicoccus rosea]
MDFDSENTPSNPAPRETIGEIIARRYSRRGALLGGLAAALATPAAAVPMRGGPSTLTFPELRHQLAQTDAVAEGHESRLLIRWGDPVLPDAPAFDPRRQTAAAQARQFGYNNDYIAVLPMRPGAPITDRALLWANHEYTNTNLMFPGMGSPGEARARVTAQQVEIELMAHGGSIVEIEREGRSWKLAPPGRLNRRITAATPMRISGPAAGHPWMRTSADPEGRLVLGTLANCAGGLTPWGTILTCEENINFAFGGALNDAAQAESQRRFGMVDNPPYGWHRHVPRFNRSLDPNESNRFGWVVEVDPYDPQSVPVKRTALGRFKHEGAAHAMAPDGRMVIYMGDDQRFDYVYRFVTARPHDPASPDRNLLDDGTLSVARFDADGTMRWLPLVQGTGPLTPANGFHNQGDVVIQARRAADLLGATPMDRPEDVEANPVNGRVYVMLTNNANRTAEQVNPANPRAANTHGHVVELIPPGAPSQPDHAAETMRWGLFLRAGKPGVDPGTEYHRATSDQGWLSCPDNCAFDSKGRIWIATDGAGSTAGIADGVWVADTTGAGRALTRLFYQAPTGAEVCGPWILPDDSALFLAIQHPGQNSGSNFETPSTRWPDFAEGMPPRPSVIVITHAGGAAIGS